MKSRLIIFLTVFLLILLLAGCAQPIRSIEMPSPTITITPTETMTPTLTLTPTVLPTDTPTAIPTFTEEQARARLLKLLASNGNCQLPCFWGIRPGLSSLNDALGIISDLANATGNSVLRDTKNNKTSYNVAFIQRRKMGIEISIYENEGDLSSIHAWITILDQKEITNQDWLAFRPENILKAYGTPERVVVNVTMGPGGEGSFASAASNPYDLRFYYDQFVIDYYYGDSNILLSSNTRVCPLLDHQIQRFDIWLGKDFVKGPIGGRDLGELTTISIDKFYTLMTSDPKKACLNLNLNIFKP